MKVSFNCTLDDFVDAQLRALKRTAIGRRARWTGGVPLALAAGAFLFAVFPGAVGAKLLAGVIGFAAAILIYAVCWESLIEFSYRSWMQRSFGEGPSFPVCVEVGADGIVTVQDTGEIRYTWPNIVEIEDTRDSFDFHERHGGIVVVRKRAFRSAGEAQDFFRTAKDYQSGKEMAVHDC